MALIKCPECGKEVSSRAAFCIHCVCPMNQAAPAEKIGAVAYEPGVSMEPEAPLWEPTYRVELPCMKEYIPGKMQAVKLTRELLQIGLAEVNELVSSPVPVVKDALSRDEAENIAQQYRALGIQARVVEE